MVNTNFKDGFEKEAGVKNWNFLELTKRTLREKGFTAKEIARKLSGDMFPSAKGKYKDLTKEWSALKSKELRGK